MADSMKSLIIDNKEKTYYISNIEFVDLNKGFTHKKLKTVYFSKINCCKNHSYYDSGYAEVLNG